MAKLTKFKAQKVEFPTHYRVEETNRGDTKIKKITPAYGNINEAGTPETEIIYDGMQLGNVHTLHAIKTTSLGIDYYSCDLDGLNDFGLKNDLKIRLTVDSDNKNINPKLRLNSVDYTILKEFKGTLLNLNAEDLKQNKTYELTYNGNQFVVINITEFGTETDTVLEGKRLAEIIGLEFGGNIQDAGTKTTGKFYYDKALKYYYECIANNNLTYNDGSKFRAISNKPILDKLENLFENSGEGHLQLGNILIQWGEVTFQNTNTYTLVYPIPFKKPPKIAISQWTTNERVYITHGGRNERNCPFSSTGKNMAFDWIAIGNI
nr:MAG TPA: putative tail fiber protein [Caudoviricetes sp.]